MLPGPVGEGRLTAQARTALLVERLAAEDHRLWLFDLPTRRLVRLSDRLCYAPHVGHPYDFDDCGVPRPMRSGGVPADLHRQDARLAFFLERPVGAAILHSVWVVPLDLSTPPRRLGATMPVSCNSPLASPYGRLVSLDVGGFDGTFSEITVGRP